MSRVRGVHELATRLLTRSRVEIALVVFTLVLLGPVVAPLNAQSASRYALTGALADRHTVNLDGYRLGVDRALYEGRLRSDKAPGQPVLAVPFYVAARAFGAENAVRSRIDGNLGLWLVTFWTSIVPFAVLLVLMYRTARRIVPQHALAAALSVGFGGLLLPYTAHLFGHVLGATLVFAAWHVLEPDFADPRRLVAFGALLGAAVFVEYQTAVAAAVVLAYALFKARGRATWLLLGAAPFAVAFGWYEDRAFGAPWRLPFGYFAGTIGGTTEGGYRIPGTHGVGLVLTGPHGLAWNCPIVVLAVVAAGWLAAYGAGVLRRDSVLALATFVPLFVMVAGWSGTPTLETPGPRYLAPAIPFLAVPLAGAWHRAPRIFIVTAAYGAAVGMSAVLSTITIPSDVVTAREYVRIVAHHELSPTLWSMAAGRIGFVCYLACAAAALLLLARAAAAPRGVAMAPSSSARSGPTGRRPS